MIVTLRDKQVLRAELIGYKPFLESECARITRGLRRAIEYTGSIITELSDYRGFPVLFNPKDEVADPLKCYPLTSYGKGTTDNKIIAGLEAVPLLFREVSGEQPKTNYPQIQVRVPDETGGDVQKLLKFLRNIDPNVNTQDLIDLSLEITPVARFWERIDRIYLAVEKPESIIIKRTKRFFDD